MSFSPIAIVGRDVLFPGASSPEALGDVVFSGRTTIREVPSERWRVPMERVLAEGRGGPDKARSARGGYVTDFERRFDPNRFEVPGDDLRDLDPSFLWALELGRGALEDAGRPTGRTAAVMGLLSFPSNALSQYAEKVWGTHPGPVDPRNRFMSGLPALLLGEALGLDGPAFSLDAACASSLYAIKLACDLLHDDSADIVLAGAVNRADDLFIHIGFTALDALSPTGQSRPFHADADGLVPAEGAGFVALCRYEDALAQKMSIHGVIRGVGLANDGRGRGLLAPSSSGQVRSMQAAFHGSGLTPADIGLAECHATGTPVGDGTELRSLLEVYGGRRGLPVGSVKSNFGHPITAAGIAGLTKILEGFRRGQRPPTRPVDRGHLLFEETTTLRLLTDAESFDGPRRACLSAFGFGGNDAHLLVEAPTETANASYPRAVARRSESASVLAVGLRAGPADSTHDVLDAFLSPRPLEPQPESESLELRLAGLRFPPKDLEVTLAQQKALVAAVQDVTEGLPFSLAGTTTGVYVGMGCDPEVARWGARWRLPEEDSRRDLLAPALTAAAVVGTMPNMPANRLSSLLDLGGPSFTVSAEEGSGLVALALARRALEAGEIDYALVAAVDFSAEPVHATALAELGIRVTPGDGAAVLLLTRPKQAPPNTQVLATLSPGPVDAPVAPRAIDARFGTSHAASPLLEAGARILAYAQRRRPGGDLDLELEPTVISVRSALSGRARFPSVEIRSAGVARSPDEPPFDIGAPDSRVDLRVATLRPGLEPNPIEGLRAFARRWPDIAFGLDSENLPALRRTLLADDGRGDPLAAKELLERLWIARLERWNFAHAELLRWPWPPPPAAEDPVCPEGAAWLVEGPLEAVAAALDEERHAHLAIRLQEERSLIVGEPAAVQRTAARLGAAHARPVGPFRVPDVAGGLLSPWIDLPHTVQDAHDRGARTFLSLGSVDLSEAIAEALGSRPHSSVHVTPEVAPSKSPRGPVLCHRSHPQRVLPTPNPRNSPVMTDDAPPPGTSPSRRMVAAPSLPAIRSAPRRSPPRWRPGGEGLQVAASHRPDRPVEAPSNRLAPELPQDGLHARALGHHVLKVEEVHRSHIARQSELQKHYLEIAGRALEVLASAARSGAFLPVMPVLETAPPPPFSPQPLRPQSRVAPEPMPANVSAPRTQIARPDEGAPTAGPRLPPVASPPPASSPSVPAKAPAPEAKAPRSASRALERIDLRPKPSPTPRRLAPSGPSFDREALKVHASGRISEIFGSEFKVQDDHPRQVRMPEPPLLLADRVTGLDAEKGSMTTGVIWTETDITEDAWYLYEGHMPAGIMIESGQADLMLISWLGCDYENRGERIYRLLGCDLTYHGGLPVPGDTLEYEIHVDGHAEQGPVRIFFFHYDGWIANERRISVRGGQAGFFTDEELANSGGILWDPVKEPPEEEGRTDPPRVPLDAVKRSFSAADVTAFASGDGRACFGPAYGRLATHTATPRISGGKMVFFDTVDVFEPSGGPWGRGYLKAHRSIRPDDWFFEGHFKNDPCMPGTLMFEGCLQTMAFYLAGLGYTLAEDGWRFEPVPEETYRLRCRGQVTPTSKDLIYEIFVHEVIDGDEPRLVADLLCTVDGLKAFHAQRMALRLIPDWPLDRVGAGELARAPAPGGRPAVAAGGVELGLDAMLACAWGRPTRAFGSMYGRFDNHRKVPRLPGPPYHFMSRVVAAPEEAMGAFSPGAEIEVEYDVPSDAWYFTDSGTGSMPFSVLLEAALQPCGWLASFIGSTLQVEEDLYFRNLDGTGTVHREVLRADGILTTKVKLERVAKTGSMIIVGFRVSCSVAAGPVYDMDTVFGFFPGESLRSQAGLPTPPETRARLEAPSSSAQPMNALEGAALLSSGRLALLDEVTGWWPEGGESGLGAIRCAMRVDPGQWFFAAHFFQDPVQPGSLGIEAMLDALRAAALLRAGPGADQRFQVLAADAPLTWKYRGQVVPENDRVEVTLELTEDSVGPRGRRFLARGSLWVDGKRIYEASGLSVELVPRGPEDGPHDDEEGETEFRFEPEGADAWLQDHRPTWTVPAVPMMVLVDRLATLAGGPPVRLEGVRLRGWVLTERTRVLRGRREGDQLTLVDERDEVVVEARVAKSTPRPEPLPPVSGPAQPLPYASGELFHGPSFEVMTAWRLGEQGASATLDPSSVQAAVPVPPGSVAPLLLDGGTHAIPHPRLDRWSPEIGADRVAYPARVEYLEIFESPPTGPTRVEARFLGLPAGPAFPRFRLQWVSEGRVWAEAELTEATFPKGRLGEAAPEDRRAFLSGAYVPGLGLSAFEADATRLDPTDVAASDWLPGTVEAVYGSRDPERIATLEHRGRIHGLHPRNLDEKLPLTKDSLSMAVGDGHLTVRSEAPSELDLSPVEAFWSQWFGRSRWPVEDVYYGLIQRFVRRVVVEDPAAFSALRGRATLFLGNHQTMVESLLFSILASAFIECPTVTIAKIEHEQSWLGTLIRQCFAYPGVEDPEVITFFDRDDKASLPGIIMDLGGKLAANQKGVMVHVEGTRAQQAVHRVERMSGAFLDLAIQTGSPVVPVRFVGGLPHETLETRIDFPVGMGQQDIWFGRPFSPEELGALPYGPRKAAVLEALDRLGGPREAEGPFPPDPDFEARVRARQAQGKAEADAVILETLLERPSRSLGMSRLLEAARQGRVLPDDGSAEGGWLHAVAQRLV